MEFNRTEYLTKLLAALVEQCGGEIHIDTYSMEKVSSGANLVVDYNGSGHEVIIRLTAKNAVVFPVCQPQTPTVPTPLPVSSTVKHFTPSEDHLAQLEKDRQTAQNLRNWEDQKREVLSRMPQPSSDLSESNGPADLRKTTG